MKTSNLYTGLLIGMMILGLVSCKEDPGTIPIIKTVAVTEDTLTEAISGGIISSEGGAAVTERGICWSANSTPTIDDNKIIEGAGTGTYSCTMTNLYKDFAYKVRAYATNSFGTAYGEEINFITAAVADGSGNVYHIKTIGPQIWMIENLKTTKYNDGTEIPFVSANAGWVNLTTPAVCWMNGDEEQSLNTYGALYNWYAIETDKLCPEGWHVPDEADWSMLIEYSGKLALAGGTLKEKGTEHWESPNIGADNYDGFTALPGAFRSSEDGTYGTFGYFSYMWSATELSSNTSLAWTKVLSYGNTKVSEQAVSKSSGLYVRCIKDDAK